MGFEKMSGITVFVAPCSSAHVAPLAASMAARVRAVRDRIPALADAPSTDDAASATLAELHHCLVALDGADVVGHLGWFEFPTFRRAPRRAVWIPEVGHSARDLDVLELLYLEASHRWADTQRQVVMLRDVEGLSADDVSALVGITDANQRVLLHRGRTRLRHQLAAEMGSP